MALMTMLNSGDTGNAEFDAAISAAGAAGGYEDSFDIAVQEVLSGVSGSGGDGQADIYGTSAPGAGLAAESGGKSVAAGLGSNWISEGMKWFDGQKDSTKGAMVTMAGSFLKGLFSYKDEQRKVKAMEKQADASSLRATTESEIAKQKMANSSSIGQTNFGATPAAGGLMYVNKLAERQKRAGGYGGTLK